MKEIGKGIGLAALAASATYLQANGIDTSWPWVLALIMTVSFFA